MAHLKDLKLRISSVKSTQKITKAMKMVSAAKLRRARERAEANRLYTRKINEIVRIAANGVDNAQAIALLHNQREIKRNLFIVLSSDRGLCGALNSSIVRMVKHKTAEAVAKGQHVRILCIGKKAFVQLSYLKDVEVKLHDKPVYGKKISIDSLNAFVMRLIMDYNQEVFDNCHVFYNRFNSAVSYSNSCAQLIPVLTDEDSHIPSEDGGYEFEPEAIKMLGFLIERSILMNLFAIVLEAVASEHGARMTAMENATSNAVEMVKDLTILYNRKRQAAITKELIEIISGAEAV